LNEHPAAGGGVETDRKGQPMSKAGRRDRHPHPGGREHVGFNDFVRRLSEKVKERVIAGRPARRSR
jgi:hypothetical protein